MAPQAMAPYITNAGPSSHAAKYHSAEGQGAVQQNHGAVGAGAVKKGQIVKFFQTRFILY
jgi:hypothetical protein